MQELTLQQVLIQGYNHCASLRSTAPINTDIMKEDKCFCSRSQVDKVFMLVLLSIWITGILQGCTELQVVKLREWLFSPLIIA